MVVAKRDILVAAANGPRDSRSSFYSKQFRQGYMGSIFPAFGLERSRCPHRAPQPARPPLGELHVEQPLHLPREAFSIGIPPHFWHPRQPIGIQIFRSYHFLKPEASVGAARATGLDTAMWCFADAKAGDGIIDHHRSSLDPAGQSLSARAIPSPHTGSQAIFGLVGQANGIFIRCRTASPAEPDQRFHPA